MICVQKEKDVRTESLFPRISVVGKRKRTKARSTLLFLLLLSSMPTMGDTASPPEDSAYKHLYEQMDKYHETFDVYRDLSSAGNHFVYLGAIGNIIEAVQIVPGSTADSCCGIDCIENRFESRTSTNWGGWYFMNGILEGADTVPGPNWGTYPDAGINLTGADSLTFWVKGKNGGEQVEFFAFGVGRDSGGQPIEPYPDSWRKVTLGYRSLPSTWVQWCIPLSDTFDLSYVLGGFGWVTNAPSNGGQDIAFYLDDILYHLDDSTQEKRLNEPRFILSYETVRSISSFDVVNSNVAFVYDNAMSSLACLAQDSLQRARLILDALVYVQDHDRWFDDGRIRNAYQAGDLILPPGWTSHGKDSTARMPGWWTDSGRTWLEDSMHVGTYAGNVAWAMIALEAGYDSIGDPRYLASAQVLGNWIADNCSDSCGTVGYTGGLEKWMDTQRKLLWKSTEHNIDLNVAFLRLFEITKNSVWYDRACSAWAFVESMWDDSSEHFWTGTADDGVTINRDVSPLDVNTWALLAMRDSVKREAYRGALEWCEQNCRRSCHTDSGDFEGFSFSDTSKGIWWEGTAQMVCTYQWMGEKDSADSLLSQIEDWQEKSPWGNSKGIVACCPDSIRTGFPNWWYFARPHIGATAWYILALQEVNPYWKYPDIGIKEDNHRRATPSFSLFRVEPNPVISGAIIKYQMPGSGHVSLKVYDMTGRIVCTLVNGKQEAGLHKVKWDGRDGNSRKAKSGIYFCRLKADGNVLTKKICLVR